MAKQPSVLSPDSESGDTDNLQSTSSRPTPHCPLRRGAPTSLNSPFQGSLSNEGGSSSASTPWGTSIPPYSPNSITSRSPHCMLLRRQSLVSSGYFSFDISPAPLSCDKATQTPSPPCQAVNHLLSAMACYAGYLEECICIKDHNVLRFSAARHPIELHNMSPEIWIAHELRRIGDEFNAAFAHRRGFPNNRPRAAEQVVILRVLRFLVRLIWRMQ